MSQIKGVFQPCTNKIQTNRRRRIQEEQRRKSSVKQNAIRIEHRQNICRLEHRTRNIFFKAGRHAYNIRIIIDFSEWCRPMAVECVFEPQKNVKEKNAVFVCGYCCSTWQSINKGMPKWICTFSVMYANYDRRNE